MDRADCVSQLCPLAVDFLEKHDQKQEVEYIAEARHAGLTGNNIQDGIRKDMFEHMLLFLSSLRCWDQGTLEKPWDTAIVYTIDPRELMDSDKVALDDTSLTVELHTDEQGESTGLVMKRLEAQQELRCLTSDGFGFNMQVVHYDTTRRLLRRGATYKSVVVEKHKTFEYRATFVWKYTLRLQWSTPFLTRSQIGDDADKNLPLTFQNPPTCHFSIACSGFGKPNAPRDANYLSDSLLCKVMDVLPLSYKTQAPFPFVMPTAGAQSTPKLSDTTGASPLAAAAAEAAAAAAAAEASSPPAAEAPSLEAVDDSSSSCDDMMIGDDEEDDDVVD